MNLLFSESIPPLLVLGRDVILFIVMSFLFYKLYFLIVKYAAQSHTITHDTQALTLDLEKTSDTNFIFRFLHACYLYSDNVSKAAPTLFLVIYIFAVSLLVDLWFHDHYGLDGPLSPTHFPFYPLFPLISMLIIGQSLYKIRRKENIREMIYIGLGAWFAVVGFITNVIWHSSGLQDSYASPPHLLFFLGMFLMIVPYLALYLKKVNKTPIQSWRQRSLNQHITIAIFFAAALMLALVIVGLLMHAQDIGGSGIQSLAIDYLKNHPHPDVQPLLKQVDALRHLSFLFSPTIYTLLFSILSINIIKKKLFPGTLTIIFLLNFLIISILHFPVSYVPVMMLPIVLLDLIVFADSSIVKRRYFPFVVATIISPIFYIAYYTFSAIFVGLYWPTYIMVLVTIYTFSFSLIICYALGLYIKRKT